MLLSCFHKWNIGLLKDYTNEPISIDSLLNFSDCDNSFDKFLWFYIVCAVMALRFPGSYGCES